MDPVALQVRPAPVGATVLLAEKPAALLADREVLMDPAGAAGDPMDRVALPATRFLMQVMGRMSHQPAKLFQAASMFILQTDTPALLTLLTTQHRG